LVSVQFFMGPSRKRKGHALLSRLEPAAAIQFCISQLSVVSCRILRTRAYLPGVPCRAGEGVQRRSWPPRQDVGGGEPDGPGAGSPGAEAPGYGPPPRLGRTATLIIATPQGLISKGWKPLAMDLRPGRCQGDADSGPAQWWLEFGLGAPAGNRTQSLFMFLFALFVFF
jgi:hypothetical protein